MSIKITGKASFMKGIKLHVKELEQEGIVQVKRAARVLQEELFRRTPVWEGETIRNYAWGVNRAPGGHKSEIGGGETGRTNVMALGAEPRRGANESAVMGELKGALSAIKKFGQSAVVTNNGDNWSMVEAGVAPSTDGGLKPRNPGGVSRIALSMARSRLEFFK